MANLYADENFPRRTVEALREFGHDIVTVADSGHANAGTSDEDVLKLANSQKRAVITINRRDFIGLHLQNSEHEGIVVCSEDTDFAALAARIHTALAAEQDLRGKLIRVNK